MTSDQTNASEIDDEHPDDAGSNRWETAPQPTPEASGLETLTPGEIDSLEMLLERFAEHAPVTNPSELIGYLSDETSIDAKFVLVELIKLDMAAAAEQGEIPRIETYVNALPELLSINDVPIDLIMEELQLRRELGEQPQGEEYNRRFPRIASAFGHLLGSQASPLELEAGDTIDDFLIIQALGAGAFAKVYLARQQTMQRLVALKVSKGGGARATGGESQALAKFDHPNVVRVFDQRSLHDPPAHLLYMQYLPGGTLADVVKSVQGHACGDRSGQILLDVVDRQLLRAAQVVPERSSVRDWLATADWPVAVAWVGVQLADALDDAHRNNIFHRDVKPANVLLSAECIPKLADFNVSEVAESAGEATFGGSIGYMAPEHLRAIDPELPGSPEDVREQADLYSLAIVLWELWQGQRPFDCAGAESKLDAIRGQLAGRGKALLEPARCGGASERLLEASLRKALSFQIDDRQGSVAEFAGRLKLALHPEAAGIFDPDAQSVRAWLMQRSPWLLAGLVVMLPNITVGFVNYWYNEGAMSHLDADAARQEYIRYFHKVLSNCFNAVAFPLGFVIALWRILPMIRAIKAAQRGANSTREGISATLNLGQHAALIGGGFWVAAALFYSLVMTWRFVEFGAFEGAQIFLSHLIAGAIAATYPFFGIAMLATLVYYPRLVRGSMQDPQFDQRWTQMIARSEAWLWTGCCIPLLGAALLTMHADDRRGFLLVLVALSFVGLLASFLAYKNLTRYWERMSEVLSTRRSSVVPD